MGSLPFVVSTPPLFFTELYSEIVEIQIASYSCKSSSNQNCVFRMMKMMMIMMIIILTQIIIIIIITQQKINSCCLLKFSNIIFQDSFPSLYSCPVLHIKIRKVPLTNLDKFMRSTGLPQHWQDSMRIIITAITR